MTIEEYFSTGPERERPIYDDLVCEWLSEAYFAATE